MEKTLEALKWTTKSGENVREDIRMALDAAYVNYEERVMLNFPVTYDFYTETGTAVVIYDGPPKTQKIAMSLSKLIERNDNNGVILFIQSLADAVEININGRKCFVVGYKR